MADLVTACIAFGSNLGDRRATLAGAYAAMAAHPEIKPLQPSRLYETAPVGGPDGQGRFLNTVLKIETTLAPDALLDACMAIEQLFKRERVIRWDARTLDLDVLLYGSRVVATPRLEVPHPRLHERRFVLVPLADVAADMIHPRLNRTIADLLAALPVEPGDVYPIADTWTTPA
jgi:2-amino-4-hydroxy-6-hydroxymethyldihydropteridine diphosphokinase